MNCSRCGFQGPNPKDGVCPKCGNKLSWIELLESKVTALCKTCGYEWQLRDENKIPKYCPNCKHPLGPPVPEKLVRCERCGEEYYLPKSSHSAYCKYCGGHIKKVGE